MPWNEPGSSNKDPWTGKPKPNTPPDLEKALRNLRHKLSQLLGSKAAKSPNPHDAPAFSVSSTVIGLSLLVLLAFWALWGIVIVAPSEQAVITRFGKYITTVGPGTHWVPRLIEDTYTFNVQAVAQYSFTTEALTEKQNLAQLSVAVKYHLADARAYLFNLYAPEANLKQAIQSAVSQVLAHTTLTALLQDDHAALNQQITELLIKILAPYHSGLVIDEVTLTRTAVPEKLTAVFAQANQALVDSGQLITQAQAYATQVAANTNGQVQQLLIAAKAYQQQAVLDAKADTAQFLALLPSYQSAPGITRERLYLATLEDVLAHTQKIFIDTQSNNTFYLPLDKLMAANSAKPLSLATPAAPFTPTPTAPVVAASPNNNPADLTVNPSMFGQLTGGYSQ